MLKTIWSEWFVFVIMLLSISCTALMVLIVFTTVTTAQCPCKNYGTCSTDKKCVCTPLYEGDDCGLRWRNQYPGWFVFFTLYRCIALMGYTTCFCIAIFLMIVYVYNSTNTQKFQVSALVNRHSILTHSSEKTSDSVSYYDSAFLDDAVFYR